MTIQVDVVVALVPYGNPASLGEPLGLWIGEANVAGDASGGFLEVRFVPQNPATTPTLSDHRRRHVFFVDGLQIQSSLDSGNFAGRIICHWARANVTLGDRFFHAVVRIPLAVQAVFRPDGPLMEDWMTRTPVFWDTQELAAGAPGICDLSAENNVNTATYVARAYGRYYDRQLLSNRSFGRLVSPPPVAPFG